MAKQTSSFCFSYEYHVFLSFRGSDTRYGFTGNLYKALDDKGIHTFIDDEELQRGLEITPALTKAIQESRIAIIVLSNNYASSSFCLDELTTILHCANTKGLLVLPVFYKVDPSDLRHHKGSYGEALAKHEKNFNVEKLKKWKEVLHHVANLSGYHFKHGEGYERDFIGKIVQFVSSKINRAPLHVAGYPVGLKSQLLQVSKLLDVGSDVGVLMIGIHGIGGIGKSTLARAVYNLIAHNFDDLCFLENIREKSNKHGLEHLQITLLSKITGEQKIELESLEQGIPMIKHRLQRKKVLLILDDVDKPQQLQAIVGEPDWLGHGSRVIITTRNKQLLASHGVERIYEVKGLCKDDAIQLLKWHAFKTKKFDPSYLEVLNQVVNYASGLPLALEVIGSNLVGKSKEEWESACNQYKNIPNSQILKILKLSFDGLEEQEKNVFLDIACFLKGHFLTEVEDILRGHYGNCVKYHIGVLVEKSLIKLSWYGTDCTVILHDLIEDMGKEIVRQESPKEPGRRSRLWLWDVIIQVLEDNTGTSKIEIICLDFSTFDKEIVEWNGKAFKKMKNLKTLVIRNGNFSKDPKYLPNSLRVLEWRGYPSKCLPSDFHPKELSICKLPDSCLTSFMLDGLSKKFVNLKVLNFDGCKCLTQISVNASNLPKLEELSFEYCENLISVHDSVGFLDKLKILSAYGCSKLRSLPPLKLTSLENLYLSFCSSLERFPEILGKMRNIRKVELLGTSIKEFPFSIQNLIGVQELSIRQRGIIQLPSSIVMMPELTKIEAFLLEGLQWITQEEGEEKVGSIVSSKIEEILAKDINLYDDFFSIGFRLFAHVKKLNLSNNNFTILPEFIKECQFLRKLDVSNCKHLQEIRGIPQSLKRFCAWHCKSLTSVNASVLLNQKLHEAGNTQYILPGAWIPEWFNHHRRGPSISFWFRNKFPDKILCLMIAPLHHIGPFTPYVFINGYQCLEGFGAGIGDGHTCLFHLRYMIFEHSPIKKHFKNEWNHVEVKYPVYNYLFPPEVRIHIFEQESCMKDVRFTDPCGKRKLDNDSESRNHQLVKKNRFVDMEDC